MNVNVNANGTQTMGVYANANAHAYVIMPQRRTRYASRSIWQKCEDVTWHGTKSVSNRIRCIDISKIKVICDEVFDRLLAPLTHILNHIVYTNGRPKSISSTMVFEAAPAKSYSSQTE